MSAEPACGEAGLDPRRIAEIIVTARGGNRRGSGYRITDTTVLTAAHVVADSVELRVRCDADRPGQWSTPAAVAWADAGSDLAVLTLTPPEQAPTSLEPVRFGRIADDRHAVIDVHAAGFPLWKRRQGPHGAFRELHQADGTVAALSNLRTGTLELTVTEAGADPDPDASPWAGMSGAAVWVGDRVVGVVAEHHRAEGPGRLAAVRLDHALRRIAEGPRAELARLLGILDPESLPLAGPRAVQDGPPGLRVVGVPVAHGIELFKNRTRERDELARHLSDPTIRMVTLTGRRGIGKSALAAKVMDLLDRGEWPGDARGPLPSGLVNLSTRTTGISLQRIYFDCARLLDPGRRAHLHTVWTTIPEPGDRLAELFAAIGGRLIVMLLDNLEDLLDDDGTIADDGLALFLRYLFLARDTPRLLVTSQVPVRLDPELRRFTAQVELSEGLSSTEAAALLRELDRDGSLGIADLSDDELLNAAVRVHGVPRALELLVGAVADEAALLPSLDDVLDDFTQRHDIVAALAQDRYQRLDAPARAVLAVLAALRTPVRQSVVDEIVGGLDPGIQTGPVLNSLVRMHLVGVDRTSRTLALHPMDADLAYAQFAEQGAFGRQEVERHIASWYARQAMPPEEWRTPDDLEPQRRRFDHLVRAGDHEDAARVLNEISDWLVWHGSVLTAVAMHSAVDGHIRDERVRLTHTAAYGHARLSAGPMEQAVELFMEAARIAERLEDLGAWQSALFGLGDAHRQLGRLDAAVEPFTRAAELARRIGDRDREAHTVLSLSLNHSYRGDGESALAGADRLDELARADGDLLTAARASNARTIALLALRRWREAADAGARTARAYRDADSQEAVAYALNAQGLGLLGLGEPASAAATLEEALGEASLMQNPRAEGVCLLDLAWAYWCEERFARCVDTAERARVALGGAGAAQEAAADALAEAARSLPENPSAAADALTRAAAALDGNPEVVVPDWLSDHAARLREA
ncbi:trypsin-like peptidase domain-containing protein [Streptomyces beihaiensis]|uniref:Trypsin-like peptidase domain-containing protein n=1 Tax=Streptomyces beihaiensis TaxID=2984495 RepID=A0ABT3U2M5_9ACTN|nr:trypsin-like peptidase domain-containing protein [Streptomyces beihaiensis]MCX3063558.1 trypsin-like peptidase domain-containing protein [Streptomyces beihaiensis]